MGEGEDLRVSGWNRAVEGREGMVGSESSIVLALNSRSCGSCKTLNREPCH